MISYHRFFLYCSWLLFYAAFKLNVHIYWKFGFWVLQGKEYVFIANSDNLGAIVDLSMSSS